MHLPPHHFDFLAALRFLSASMRAFSASTRASASSLVVSADVKATLTVLAAHHLTVEGSPPSPLGLTSLSVLLVSLPVLFLLLLVLPR